MVRPGDRRPRSRAEAAAAGGPARDGDLHRLVVVVAADLADGHSSSPSNDPRVLPSPAPYRTSPLTWPPGVGPSGHAPELRDGDGGRGRARHFGRRERLHARQGEARSGMIARYTHPEMGRLWSDQRRYEAWLAVEMAAADAIQRPIRNPRARWVGRARRDRRPARRTGSAAARADHRHQKQRRRFLRRGAI
mgnify:CR=1 FL=1